MKNKLIDSRPIHSDFQYLLDMKEQEVIDLFRDLCQYIMELYPDSNEILYHTHVLASVFSISDKLSDAFCMLPIYTNHMNLGFNKGTLLKDPDKLLTGTGNWIRHLVVKNPVKGDLMKPLVEGNWEASTPFNLFIKWNCLREIEVEKFRNFYKNSTILFSKVM